MDKMGAAHIQLGNGISTLSGRAMKGQWWRVVTVDRRRLSSSGSGGGQGWTAVKLSGQGKIGGVVDLVMQGYFNGDKLIQG